MSLKFIIFILLLQISAIFAATPIDLSKIPTALLQPDISLKEKSRLSDFNQTLHIRVQQMYLGYPVKGATGVIHVPHSSHFISANGKIYLNLEKDLGKILKFDQQKAQQAMQQALLSYKNSYITDKKIYPIIYIDKKNNAHFSYQISFYAMLDNNKLPHHFITIVDAESFSIYKKWDDLKTFAADFAGGYGGNKRMGKVIYDGTANHLPALTIERNAENKICYFKNANAKILRCKDFNKICLATEDYTMSCEKPDANYQLYWHGADDEVNDGYSPANDALFYAEIVNKMYQEWYGTAVLQHFEPLTVIIHLPIDDAYWDKNSVHVGDGHYRFYPLTSLSIIAHEASHGFTERFSNLSYLGSQSGAINESFSDMAAKASEYYLHKRNLHWQIAPEVFKAPGLALRYMDQPSKDCYGSIPGIGCSVDHLDQLEDEELDIHFSSGIYNHAFYYLSNSLHWNTKMAFDVMVKANMHYWVEEEDFYHGACGVLYATLDYAKNNAEYDPDAVKTAFNKVGIDTKNCNQTSMH